MSVLFGRSVGFDRLVLVFRGFRVFAVFTYLLEVSGVRSFRFLLGGVLGSIVSVLFGRFPRFDRFGFVCELFLGRLLTMIVLNYLLKISRVLSFRFVGEVSGVLPFRFWGEVCGV